MRRGHLPAESEVLDQVVVRLLGPQEREEFDRRLKADHYLHQAVLPGPCLRYVAEVQGQWVALLTFSPGSFHLKPRDKSIGWSARQRARRLKFVLNNSRFLVLLERERVPNLASRVLALTLRRLSDDWLEHHGNPVLMVETFVDESRYRGTCYRACGFESIGPTGGFSRNARDFYIEHGQPKQLYLRQVHPQGRALLRRPRLPQDLRQHEGIEAGPCPLQAPALNSLLEGFRTLRESRRGHGLRHRQSCVLATAAVCTLMGASGYRSFEAISSKFTQRQLRALGCPLGADGKRHPPSDSTFRRVIQGCEVRRFVSLVGRWLLEQEVGVVARLALDGKTLRGSGRRDGKALQIFSAVTHQLCLTLEQVPIEEKTNEIPTFTTLLERMEIAAGTLVTADAMHCQQESARYVTQELSGDYLFGLKGNQSGILDRAERLLAQQAFPPGRAGAVGEAP